MVHWWSTLTAPRKQKVRGQERGHDSVERRLVALGARPPAAGQRPAEWLDGALRDIGCRRLRHRGCLRFAWPLGTTRRQRAQVVIALPALGYPKSPDPLV
ncbi:MAG: hypothetical protein M3083_22425 [Actinomycetota bacterium]|nr:hypothetical protein [Actinomycetota bacterium]